MIRNDWNDYNASENSTMEKNLAISKQSWRCMYSSNSTCEYRETLEQVHKETCLTVFWSMVCSNKTVETIEISIGKMVKLWYIHIMKHTVVKMNELGLWLSNILPRVGNIVYTMISTHLYALRTLTKLYSNWVHVMHSVLFLLYFSKLVQDLLNWYCELQMVCNSLKKPWTKSHINQP